MSEFFRKPIVKTLMLKGQEGQSIKEIKKTSTSGFVDTYTITLTDGTTSTFTVTNGKEISSIDKTGTSGLVDTYTINFNDGTTSTFTVTNGKEISSIDKTGTSGLVDTYTINFNDGTASTFTVTNGDDNAYKPAVDALGKRIDNLILHSGTESSAEVIDARTGYNGAAYDTLGTAIRTQFNNQEAKFAMNFNDLNNLIENTNIAYGTATCTSDWKKIDILNFNLKSGTNYKIFVTLEDAPTGSTYVYLDRGTGTIDNAQMNGKTEYIFSIVPSIDSTAVLQINSGSYTGKVNAYVSVLNKKNTFEKINERFEKAESEFNDTVTNLCFYEGSNVSVSILKYQSEKKADISVSGKVKLPSCESYFIEFGNALYSSDDIGNIEIKINEYDSSNKFVSATIMKLTNHKMLVKKAPTSVNAEILISYNNIQAQFNLIFDKICLYANAKKSIREDVQVKINDTSNVKYLKSIIPKYWIENGSDYTRYLEDKIKNANSIVSDAKFAFITDPHWLGNAKNSNNIFGYVTKKMGIKDCFNGGDILMNMTDTPLAKQAKFSMDSYMNDLNDIIPENLHYIMGNHDTNQTNAPSGATSSDYVNARLSYKDIYEVCIEPWKNGKYFSDKLEWASWAIGTPQYYWNRMHYYVDDEKSRIRYIVLNSGASGELASLVGSNGEEFYWQLNWLYQTLMNMEEGWTCIVFAHQFLSDKEIDTENHYYDIWSYSKPIAKMLISARNKTVYKPDFTHAQVLESYDFTNIKSIDVACMICGHSHVDESIIYDAPTDISEIGNAVTSNSQMLVICTTCDAYTNTAHPQYEMIKGTTTEQAFDVFSIDKTNKKIYTTRIGVGKDREFKYATD